VKTKLNLEMAAVQEMIEIALKTGPDLVTLVPEKREELTTEGGLDVAANREHYKRAVDRLKSKEILVSFFVDANPDQIRAAHECGGDIVEIHTGHYSDAENEAESNSLFDRIRLGVQTAQENGLRISAGHGLNYVNVKPFKALPQVEEYSIGHSIVARAILVGFERAVREMIELVKDF
jgi:pyridoxine 5-phosphate synthase